MVTMWAHPLQIKIMAHFLAGLTLSPAHCGALILAHAGPFFSDVRACLYASGTPCSCK